MKLRVRFDREEDGRWIAEISGLNVLAYGETRQEALARAQAVALEVIADSIQRGETGQRPLTISFETR